MIDKERLTAHIQDIGLKQEIKQILSIYEISNKTYSTKNTKFLTPNHIYLVEEILRQFTDTKVKAFSLNAHAERKVLYFYPEYYDFDDIEINLSIIRIATKSKQSGLTHRDYLGSMLSLGIERDNIGDIVFDTEKRAYAIVIKPLDQYLLDNLSKIKHESVRLEIVEEFPELDDQYEELTVNVASVRLDAIIARILNLSRERAQGLIQSGRVNVNYVESKDKSSMIKDGSIISIRGYGKYRFEKVISETKKNRLSIKVLKYIN